MIFCIEESVTGTAMSQATRVGRAHSGVSYVEFSLRFCCCIRRSQIPLPPTPLHPPPSSPHPFFSFPSSSFFLPFSSATSYTDFLSNTPCSQSPSVQTAMRLHTSSSSSYTEHASRVGCISESSCVCVLGVTAVIRLLLALRSHKRHWHATNRCCQRRSHRCIWRYRLIFVLTC